MSGLSKTNVLHVAKLSKLSLSSAEVKKFSKQLSEVIAYVEELNEVDTANCEPTSQTTGLTNITRSDKSSSADALGIDKALSGSEKVYNDYFKVPPLIEK
jgi:aspartyl-tRNA(Asn)/glutamyl-tRNA(Gln) amidotransferase subunit C